MTDTGESEQTVSLLQELVDVNKKILKTEIINTSRLAEAKTPGIFSTIGRNIASNFIWYIILGLIIALLLVILWNTIKSFFSSLLSKVTKSIFKI